MPLSVLILMAINVWIQTNLKRSLLKLNVDIDENQIDKLIAKYDVDSNGTVDYGKLVDSIDSEKKTKFR